jgi:hypothetical protein
MGEEMQIGRGGQKLEGGIGREGRGKFFKTIIV